MNNKKEHIVIKYLNRFYGDFKEHRTDKHPNSTFFVKGKKVFMEQELESGRIYVDYDTIWVDLENMFILEIPEIQSIIPKWVKETYKLEGVTSLSASIATIVKVEETFKLK